MRTKIFTFLLLIASVTTAISQSSITVIQGLTTHGLYARGLSSDGTYLTGQAGAQHHLFAWKKDGNVLIENDTFKLASNLGQMGSNAFNVTPSGLVAGLCPNPDYLFADMSPEGIYGDNNVPTAAIFNFETRQWDFLPIVSSIPLQYIFGSCAYAISDDGKVIAGCQNPGGLAYRWIAGYWKKDTVSSTYIYKALAEDVSPSRGSLAKAISGNGLAIGGFECDQHGYVPKPVLWTSKNGGVTYSKVTIPRQSTGVVEAISNNGKYAALSIIKSEDFGYATLYDIETREITEINSTGPAAALAVSDSGIVVGHFGGLYYGGLISPYNIMPGRHIEDAISGGGAYIFTKTMGAKLLKDFFDENNITYPSGFVFKAATGISADGRKICGHGIYNGKNVSFYAEIPEITAKGVFAATNFSIESPAYGSILLTWDPVPEDVDFTGYKIFNANNPTTPVATVTGTSYRIDGLPNGKHSYYIVSSYTSKDAEKTKTLSYNLDKKSLPLFEEFSYSDISSLINSGWDVSYNTSIESWFLDQQSGYPAACAKFLSPVGGSYNESLTSPYLDATATTSLRLSFLMVVPSSDIAGASDEWVLIEIFADSAWHIVDEIQAVGDYNWHDKTYNLDEYAGKDNIRIRFRATGQSVGATLNWFLDNVELADQNDMFVEEDPLDVSANYVEEEKKAHVQWSDPRGFVSLRYSILDGPQDMVSSVGNGGESIIAVNKYTAEDLSAFEGYKITSISFLRGTNPDTVITNEPEFKWYVSQGEGRLFEQEIVNTQAGVWETVTLDNPVAIDNTKPLYYGVEVTQHDAFDWPLATGYIWKEKFVNGMIEYYGSPVADGRANLFSVDGGNTWDKLSNHLIDSLNPDGDPQIFLLRATLAKDPSVEKKGRLMGYRIFRDGMSMLETGSLTSLNNYTDTLPVTGTACYKVHAFYTTNNPSQGKEACIVIENNSNEQTKQANSDLKAYPTFVQKGETITVETSGAIGGTLRLYDAMGKTVKSIPVKSTVTSLSMNVASGVYLLQLDNKASIKLIVK
ncbi:MAG: T9SS type A sorting domain-containing protein [Bacteroidales bacterium]|jgi:uncharacterized membrane protein|nr:T9SS type A sorting domain-containing protein [Bacteroidales bacterium]